MVRESVRPPLGPEPHASEAPAPEELHHTVVASDTTRLFVRTARRQGAFEGEAPLPTPNALQTLFCDGILCDGFIWKYLWGELATISNVAHFHYRGHGRSGAPASEDRIEIADHARDAYTVRQHLGNPPCVLIGHSMGTQVCLETWRLFPEQVRGLVLICGSFGRVTQTFRGVPILDSVLPKIIAAVDRQKDLARAIWSRIPPDMAFRAALLAGDIDPALVRREDVVPYIEHMTHVDLMMFLRMLQCAGSHSAETYLSKINVPVLIIAGDRDTFTPGSLSEWMASQIPNAELLMIRGGTHIAPLEHPSTVGKRIRAFLTRVAATDDPPPA